MVITLYTALYICYNMCYVYDRTDISINKRINNEKKKLKNNRNRLSFGLFRFEPKKKIIFFRGYPNREHCLEVFSVCFGCFDTGPKHRNKPKQTEKNFFGFAKQTEKQPKQIVFRFVSVQSEKKI
jgi:hypothetical protein